MRLDLILSMRDIYISSNLNSLTKFNNSGRSTGFKDILLCNFALMIMKTVSITTRIVNKVCDEGGHPVVNKMESQ